MSATVVLLLLHVPPDVALVMVMVKPPAHTVDAPTIAAGNGNTVTIVVMIQPVESVYVITEVPAEMPVTTPDINPTWAFEVSELDHVPPVSVSDNEVVCPTHTVLIPSIGVGSGLTVTTVVRKQPVASVYVTITVPGLVPVTPTDVPVGVIVAVPVPGVMLHVPPGVVVLSVVVRPLHTAMIPVIGVGNGLTVTTAVT
jgi:hypothetical protein